MASKIFATQCFFSDHLNYKIVNQTNCRTPSANPRQLWAQKAFELLRLFLRLSEFPDSSGKVFLITFKPLLLDYLTMFRKSNVNQTV